GVRRRAPVTNGRRRHPDQSGRGVARGAPKIGDSARVLGSGHGRASRHSQRVSFSRGVFGCTHHRRTFLSHWALTSRLATSFSWKGTLRYRRLSTTSPMAGAFGAVDVWPAAEVWVSRLCRT